MLKNLVDYPFRKTGLGTNQQLGRWLTTHIPRFSRLTITTTRVLKGMRIERVGCPPRCTPQRVIRILTNLQIEL